MRPICKLVQAVRLAAAVMLLLCASCTAPTGNFDAGQAGDATFEPSCIPTLFGVGAGDFTIRFKVATNATVASTLIYQRQTCDATHDLWDIQLTPAGRLRIAVLEAGGVYTDLTTNVSVNDGNVHDVVVRRAALILTTTTDGNETGSAAAPQNLGQLTPLGISTGDPCEGAGGLKPLPMAVSGVCLTRP